jgi:hypothetical protein
MHNKINSKMKTTKLIILSFILLMAGTASFAQFKFKAPHGGFLKKAGSYHIEMVQSESKLTFYLLDAKGKTLSNKSVKGSVLYEFFNKSKATSSLTNDKKNGFIVDIPKASVFTYCTVTLVVKGKNISAKFINDNVSEQDIEHGHQH